MDKEKLIMPQEYFGEQLQKSKYVNTTPRRWTKKEIEWCKIQYDKGYSYSEIGNATGRSGTSVNIKLNREKKKDDKYNISYRDEKYSINKEFIEKIEPKSVLDVFCGVASYYKTTNIPSLITNDIDKKIEADYHLDYLKLLCLMYYEGKSFDIVDINPFGSAYDGFDLAIKMANKGLVITFGEMGHKRFKRLDYVSRYYGINTLEEFHIDNMIKEVQRIGLKNKKELKVFKVMEKQHITRVWFTIGDIKIISQWT